MSLSVHAVTVNALSPFILATFWSRALGGEPADSGNGYILVETHSECLPRLLFAPVEQHAHAPGRIHLDLTSPDVPGELERLVALGATVVEERRDSAFTWTVLADPEGNLFCLG